jgi:hypothetical protein
VLATALLAVTALGVAATLRLAQHARLGPLENSSSLAYTDASDWNQFADPTAARRFDELMRPIESARMPVSETAIVDTPAPTAPSALPETTALDVTNAATAMPLATAAPREPSAIPELPPATTVSSPPVADPLVSIAPDADPRLGQYALAGASQEAVVATLPEQSLEVAARATPLPLLRSELPPEPTTTARSEAPALPQPAASATNAPTSTAVATLIERATAVPNVAVPEQAETHGQVTAPAHPSIAAPATIVALDLDLGRGVPAEPTRAPPVAPAPGETGWVTPKTVASAATAPQPTDPALIDLSSVLPMPIIAPLPTAELERVASLPMALRGVQVTSKPFPPLPRAAPHRNFGKSAPQAHTTPRRYSTMRRVRTLRTAQTQPASPISSLFRPMNFTAVTAQPSGLFSPAPTITGASRNHSGNESKASLPYSDYVSSNAPPHSFSTDR